MIRYVAPALAFVAFLLSPFVAVWVHDRYCPRHGKRRERGR